MPQVTRVQVLFTDRPGRELPQIAARQLAAGSLTPRGLSATAAISRGTACGKRPRNAREESGVIQSEGRSLQSATGGSDGTHRTQEGTKMSKMKTEKRNANNRTQNPDTKLVSRKLLLNRELRILSAQVLEEVVGGGASPLPQGPPSRGWS